MEQLLSKKLILQYFKEPTIMIQRIQTLYLLIVTLLIGFFFFIPFSTFIVEPQMVKYVFMTSGLTSEGITAESIYKTWPLLIILIIVFAIPLQFSFIKGECYKLDFVL